MNAENKKRIEQLQSGEVPEDFVQGTGNYLPVDWDTKIIHQLMSPVTQKAGDGDYEILSITAGKGYVRQSEKFGKDIAGKQYEQYTVLKKGDFSYNKGNSKTYPQGCVYMLEDREQAVVPNVFNSFRPNGNNIVPEYYKHLFISGYLNHQLFRLINSGVRNDGLLNLYDDDFYGCILPVPPLLEQRKIAEILTHCNKVIDLKKQLIEEKRSRKKWLMQNLLNPDSGVRLPGFEGEWKKTTLGKHVIIHSGDAPSKYELVDIGTPYYKVDCLNYGDVYIESKSYLVDSVEKCIPAFSVLFPKRGAAIMNNKVRINRSPCYIDSNLMALEPKNSIKFDYLFAFLRNEKLFKIADTSTIPQINNKHILPYEFSLPSINEQTAIANVLSTADHELDLLEQELTHWQSKKKALMQLLLTGIVRVMA